VSYVNAPQLAEQRGLEVRETSTATSLDYKSLITLRSVALGGRHAELGRPAHRAAHRHGRRPRGRGGTVAHMLVVRNDDRPGMIGMVGTALGAAGISISSMAVGPSPTARRP
jgi:D-3-phosphoglycerate dehydrogenase